MVGAIRLDQEVGLLFVIPTLSGAKGRNPSGFHRITGIRTGPRSMSGRSQNLDSKDFAEREISAS